MILSCSLMGRIPIHGMPRAVKNLPRAGWVAHIRSKGPMEDHVLCSSRVVTFFSGGKMDRKRDPDCHC